MDILEKATYIQQATIFKALAHESRLQIIVSLFDGSKCVNDLRDIVGSDISTVSKHLSVLKNAGIVSGKKQGNSIFYSISMPCVRSFIDCISGRDDIKECSCHDK